jgi:endonuclease/exonuclease/phosphatase family metal-dependent hydrolase
MSNITDVPPLEILNELNNLRAQLDRDVPLKVFDRNLLIATWNIRAFGNLTKKWNSETDDSPRRDFRALREITEIVSRFHVIAIQEVRANIRSLRYMLKLLGPHWGVILTDVTKGSSGNYERMAFLFDTRVVKPSGLACELVVPPEQLEKEAIKPDALSRQFARTPYAVSFQAHEHTFILVTMHAIYGDGTKERKKELKAIAEWLAEWAKDINAWDHNLIALGDFNIDRKGDDLYEAFTATGLRAPGKLDKAPRTIFDVGSDTSHFYDQIAWFTGENNLPILSMENQDAGYFDFMETALKGLDLSKNSLSWRISDHYPLWAEFSLMK